jgi:hypothetical protein
MDFDFFCGWMEDSLKRLVSEQLYYYFNTVMDSTFKKRQEELEEYFD